MPIEAALWMEKPALRPAFRLRGRTAADVERISGGAASGVYVRLSTGYPLPCLHPPASRPPDHPTTRPPTHLGSTALVTNDQGGEVARQWYFPYGDQRHATGSLPTDYRFTGQRKDGHIKLTEMGARWYDPAIGRWISPDSIIPEPGNPQSLNRYSYVYNNPVRYTDSTGHRVDPGDTGADKKRNADPPPPPPPMGTWDFVKYLLTLVPEGRDVLSYIYSHGTKIHVVDNLPGRAYALYPNNMIILHATPFTTKDLDTQIDVAGDIGHEVEHLIWGNRGALGDSKEQEGAAFARGDAVKAALFRYFGKEGIAATYEFPTMSTDQRIEALRKHPEYGSVLYTDRQIWSPFDLVRDVGSTISRWYYDWWYNQNCRSSVRGVYP